MEKTLVIGAGEIGKSLANVLKNAYEVHLRDIDTKLEGQFDVIHIAYPCKKDNTNFIKATQAYIEQYKPKLVIIHSTLPIGTTRLLGPIAVHSPTNGRHPDLTKHIQLFRKVIAGISPYSVFEAAKHLNAAGINTLQFSSPEASELAKINCTSNQYALAIIAMKETVERCMKYDVPFQEVYTGWNMMYNEGYSKIGEGRFTRPLLEPMGGEIGRHCVMPNTEFIDDELTRFIKGRNESYKGAKNESRKKNKNLAS